MKLRFYFFIVLFLTVSISLLSADTTITNFFNSANNSLGDSTNLSFDQAESNFVYFQIPKNSTVINASMNVSGYVDYIYTEENWDGGTFDITGLTWNGTHYWASTFLPEVVVAYNSTGGYVTNFSTSTEDTTLTGIYWNGTRFLVVGSDFDHVIVYNSAGVFITNYSIGAQDNSPWGITSDGSFIYIVGRQYDKVFKYYLNLTYEGTNFSVGSSPRGITYSGTTLWVADSSTAELVEYSTSGTATGQTIYMGEQERTPLGVINRSSCFWVSGGFQDEVFEYCETYLTNLSLDIANNANTDWSMTGELNSSNSPKNITLNVTAINDYVDTTAADANGYVYVPLNFTSDTAGVIEVSNLELWYNDDLMTVDFVSPTESNNTIIIKNWTFINITSVADVDNPLNIDTCTLNFNGNSTAMTKVGSGTSVSCYLNKTNVPGGYYIYNVTVNNSGGEENTSETRHLAMDITAPVISGVNHGPSRAFSTIIWTTDDLSNSLVRYGLNTGSYTNTVSSSNNVTSHALTITGLTADTLYYYVVNSTNRAGLNSQSSEKIFLTTLAGSGGQTSSGGGGIAPPPEVVEVEKEVLVFPKAKIELSKTSGREEILLIYKDKNASKYFFVKNVGENKTIINITTSNSLKPFVDAYFLEMDFSRPERSKTIRAGESKIVYIEVQGLYPDYNINSGVEGSVIIATPEGVANIIVQVVRPPAYSFLIKPLTDFLEGKVKGNPEHSVMIPMYLLTVALFGFLVYIIRK